jgi:RimK family alpha-L-glutamate ligase
MPVIPLTAGSGWHIQDLLRAGAKTGIAVQPARWDSVSGHLDSSQLSKDAIGLTVGPYTVTPADQILLRTMPHGSLEQIITRMNLLHRAQSRGLTVMNSPRSVEIAIDKFLTLQTLADAGLPVPPTAVAQRIDEARTLFKSLGGDVVIKPLFGSEGFGITRASDPDIADRIFDTLEKLNQVIYLQAFIDHADTDYRVFVLDGKILAAMRRASHNGDWRSNVARGGTGHSIPIENARDLHGLPGLGTLALQAAKACNLDVTGVDILLDKNNQPHIIEVNGVPGWRELARVTNIDIAAHVLQSIKAK